MKLAAMFGSSSGAIGATAVGAVVVVAGAVGITLFNDEPDALSVPDTQVVIEADTPELAPAELAPGEPEPIADESPEPSPSFEAPRLDLVRVDADGGAVIAGQTSPNLPVAILLDGAVIAEALADGSGAFVALLTLEPSDAPRQLSVEARPDGAPAVAGLETVLVAPFAAAPLAVASLEPEEPATDAAPIQDVAEVPDLSDATAVDPESPVEIADATAPDLDLAPAPDLAAVPDPDLAPAPPPEAPGVLAAAPTSPRTLGVSSAAVDVARDTRPTALPPARAAVPAVVIASPEGLRVVQGATPEPAVQTSVQLDAISYDTEGAVTLAGRGPVAADIQIYLNNQPIQLGEIGPRGDWSLQLPDVDPGTYSLAVAELAGDGSTVSRVETPFLREDPERVAEAPRQAAEAGIDVITVQPGFTLWGIAENALGEGLLYVQIFEENRDQINDPNWIFPGQIFRLPDVEGELSAN